MNLARIIDSHPDDLVAIISRGRPTTYGTLRDQVAHLRGGLARLGVQSGDRIALLCSNGRYFVDFYLAALGLGAVTVPLNPSSPGPEIEREVATVGAKVVVVEPLAAHAWSQVDRSEVPTVSHVVATEADTVAAAESVAVRVPVPVAVAVAVPVPVCEPVPEPVPEPVAAPVPVTVPEPLAVALRVPVRVPLRLAVLVGEPV